MIVMLFWLKLQRNLRKYHLEQNTLISDKGSPDASYKDDGVFLRELYFGNASRRIIIFSHQLFHIEKFGGYFFAINRIMLTFAVLFNQKRKQLWKWY